MASDIRLQSLVFLRIRAFLRGEHNVEIIRGEIDDPRLPKDFAAAVLISNTYHELNHAIGWHPFRQIENPCLNRR